jgi:hypothetical protein
MMNARTQQAASSQAAPWIAMAAAIFVINFCGYPAAAWLF